MTEPTSRVPRPRRPESSPESSPENSPVVSPGRLKRVIVGVDGSSASSHALVWAMRYAAKHGCAVVVMTAWPIGDAVFVHEVPGHFAQARWSAVEAQTRALAQAMSLVDSPPPYTRRLENADACTALVKAALPGDVVVLGSDRSGGAARIHERPVDAPLAVRVQRESSCPVLLIPLSEAQEQPAEPSGSQLAVAVTAGREA